MRVGAGVSIVLQIALAGCAAEPSPPPAPPAGTGSVAATPGTGTAVPDPCTLLTKDDLGPVLGPARDAPAVPGTNEPGERTCTYDIDAPLAVVTVSVFPGGRATFDRHETAVKKTDDAQLSRSSHAEARHLSKIYKKAPSR